MKLTIIRGLPGSGKSTMAKSLGCFHVEADMYHITNGVYVYQKEKDAKACLWRKHAVELGLSHGMDVVVTGTFTTSEEVAVYQECATEYKADVEIIRKTSAYGSIHCVPESVIKGMADRFEDIDGEVVFN